MAKPQVQLSLEWSGDLAFRAEAPRRRQVVVDGNSRHGLSPVEMLAAATASCMAIDVVHILTRGRAAVDSLRVEVAADRADAEPHRITRMQLAIEIEGQVSQPQLDRAIQLSRDKYCSVWNTLREDTVLEITSAIRGADSRG